MRKPFRISEIDLNNIVYSNPVIKDDKKNILLKYQVNNNNQQFIIQTPELICASAPILKNDIYEINIAIQSKSSKKVNSLIEFIEAIDEKMKELANNNKEWFDGDKFIYRKIIRNNSKYQNGILKLKVKKNSIPKFLKVTKNRQSEISLLSEIKEGYKIKLIIDLFGLWIRKKNNVYYYGLYLKPILIDYKVEEEVTFIEDSESENENDKVNEILDTEFEQNYDNTESISNLKEEIKNSGTVSDSSSKNENISLKPISLLTDTISCGIRFEDSNNKEIVNESELIGENNKSDVSIPQIEDNKIFEKLNDSDSGSDEDKVKENIMNNSDESESDDNNSKIINMYDNTSTKNILDNSDNNTTSTDNLDKFNIETSEIKN
jgi:hypothetical protein